MKFPKTSLLIGLLASGILVSAQDATPTVDPCVNPTNTMIQWMTKDTSCALHEEVSFVFDVSYPQDIALKSPAAAAAMLDYINQERTTFWESAAQSTTPEYFGSAPWTLEITYETFEHSESVVSVLFNVYTYTGGAHPNTYFKTFTFDVANNTVYTLADLFKPEVQVPDVLVPTVRAQLQTTLADFPDFIESGTDPHPDTTTYPGLDNYANWILTADSLVIYFPPYQVAPYVAGPQKVEIPLADLADSLKPEFLPHS